MHEFSVLFRDLLCHDRVNGLIEIKCSVTTAEEALAMVSSAYPENEVLRVSRLDAFDFPVPENKRTNPQYYSERELHEALVCVNNLFNDYWRGEQRGGSMEWEDLDATHSSALCALPRLAVLKHRNSYDDVEDVDCET